ENAADQTQNFFLALMSRRDGLHQGAEHGSGGQRHHITPYGIHQITPFMKQTVLSSCIRQQVPVAASRSPMAWAKLSVNAVWFSWPTTPHRAAVNFRRKYCSPILKKGAAAMAKIASSP